MGRPDRRLTAATERDGEQVGRPAEAGREEAGKSVDLAYVDQGYAGEAAAGTAKRQEIGPSVVKLPGGELPVRTAAGASGRGAELRLGASSGSPYGWLANHPTDVRRTSRAGH